MFSRLLFVLSLAVSFSVHAATCGTWANAHGVGDYPTPLEACQSTYPYPIATSARINSNNTSASCLTGAGGTLATVHINQGSCHPDVCTAKKGDSQITNVTSGWKRSPKIDDPGEEWVVTYLLPPSGRATICGGSSVCEMTIDAHEPCSECSAYVSQVPGANGLYRVSTDFRGHFTGETCTSSSASDLPPEALHKDDVKDPPCPGFVGEVNGVKGCFGTADKPVRPVPAPPKPSGISDTDQGNPSAGSKPTSGEGSGTGGSGRTPAAGAGGSSGGPSGAASGSNGGTEPDGTTPKPGEGKEQVNCGAPGQPKCGIDESGTPSKFEGKGDLLGGWEEGVKTNRATIEKSGTGIFESFNVFFSAPPLAGCEPIELPNDQVITRHCDVVEGTRSVMAYIWALTALWLCVGWIREAI